MWGEVKVANSLQEAVTAYGSPYSLEDHVTELKDALKGVEEWYDVASASVKEKVQHVENY